MQASSELRDLYVQLCQAQTQGDSAFFERRFSQKDGVVAIGSDPAEWWAGYDAIAKVFKTQLEEAGGFEVVPDTPLAYQDGSIGWVAGRPTLKLPKDVEVPLRLTAVFQKEPEGWKIVQWHMSMGVANEDAIGEILTTE